MVEDENEDQSECCWRCSDDDSYVERGDRTPEQVSIIPFILCQNMLSNYLHMYAEVLQFYTIPFQVDMLRDRSRNYLIMHLILGGAIFGISLAILGKICVSISYSYFLSIYILNRPIISLIENKNLFQECSSISQPHLSL